MDTDATNVLPATSGELGEALPWRRAIYLGMLQRMHTFEADNLDTRRYADTPANGFFVNDHLVFMTQFADHWRDFHRTRQLLVDEHSRSLYDELVLYRLLGHLHVRLSTNVPARMAAVKVPDDWFVSYTGESGPFGNLNIYQVPVGDDHVWLKGWVENVEAYLWGQYYFRRDAVEIVPSAGDHVVDGGACFGDTALLFANAVGPSGHVYAFDPLGKHCRIAREAFALNTDLASRVSLFEAGLADGDESGSGHTGEDINPGARVGKGSGLNLRAIDSAVADGSIARVDFIKLDVEGSELAALRGAEGALRRWKPKLAISLYHRPDDFHVIPAWLDGLGLGYRFYLDHYTIHHEETVLYAVADAA